MSLQNWLQSGYLLKHQATVAEVQKLLKLVDRELSDAAASGLSCDARFQHAYNAALQLCKLALHASGFEAVRGPGHHSRWIESLPHTLGSQQAPISKYLSTCSAQRRRIEYDDAGVVSEQDAKDLLDTARQLRTGILAYLRTNHSKLLPKGY